MLVHSPSMDTLVTFRYEPIKSGEGTVRVETDERSMHSPPVADVTSQITKSCTHRKAVWGQVAGGLNGVKRNGASVGLARHRVDCMEWLGCTHVMNGRSRMTIHPCIATISEAENVGFSPTRHMLLVTSAKRWPRPITGTGEVHLDKNHLCGGGFVHMDGSVELMGEVGGCYNGSYG